MFPIARTLVIAKDARRAAQISCALALPGHYLPVVEGPRFLPPDPTAELVRRNNAAARVRPESIFITGLSGVLAADTTWVLKEVLGSRASLAAAGARRFRIGTPTQRQRDSIRLGRSGVL